MTRKSSSDGLYLGDGGLKVGLSGKYDGLVGTYPSSSGNFSSITTLGFLIVGQVAADTDALFPRRRGGDAGADSQSDIGDL